MKVASIRAVEMVRKIRDQHSRALASKKPSDVIAFYRSAGEAALEEARSRTRTALRKAS
jgi:hypothetical protein